jgi:hypothetical protein
LGEDRSHYQNARGRLNNRVTDPGQGTKDKQVTQEGGSIENEAVYSLRLKSGFQHIETLDADITLAAVALHPV